MIMINTSLTCGLHMHRECRERFSRCRIKRKPLVSDPGMHHGTCVTHVPWCMTGSLTHSGGKNVPGVSGACATRNFTYLVRGPWQWKQNIPMQSPFVSFTMTVLHHIYTRVSGSGFRIPICQLTCVFLSGPPVSPTPGPVSIWRPSFQGKGIPMLKIRRSRDSRIFHTGILTLLRWHFYIETAPRSPTSRTVLRTRMPCRLFARAAAALFMTSRAIWYVFFWWFWSSLVCSVWQWASWSGDFKFSSTSTAVLDWRPDIITQRAHTCTENVLPTRFQDVQNVNLEDVHETQN